jgi:amino acid adenylation domain-containing protein
MSRAETTDLAPAAAPEAAPPPAAEGARPRPDLSAAKQALRDARLRGLHRAPPMAPIAPAAGAGAAEAPLSFAQERLWFLERLQPGTASYVIPCAVRLTGALDAGALERALGELLRRHDVLRTTFRDVDGVPVQEVAPFAGLALPVDDLRALDDPSREAEVARRAADDAARPFDLQAGPPFRARLLRLGPEEHVLLLSMHHIVSDGWSLGVLFRELWALYGAFREGRPSPLPPLPLQYAAFAAWQRAQLEGPAMQRQLAYWKERLAGAPELLELPTDHPRPPVPTYRGGAVPVRVPPAVLDGLRALERAEGATLFMVVLAAFQLLLSRYGGSDDVLVGTPAAGRGRRDVEGLVGLFLNTLVLRTDLSGDPAFRALVRRVRARALADYGHQDLPFERLVAELRPERTLSHAPVFQVMYQLDSEPEAASAVAGLRVRMLPAPRDTSKFDLSLVMDAHAGGLSGVLEYSADLFEPGTARRMAEHLEHLLAQAAADPDRPLSRLELAGPEEGARVAAWNRTEAPCSPHRCVHDLFRDQAARTPDAPAVLAAAGSLAYGELDARANRLAHHLARMGVGPETRVGLCMERGPELLVALLGVLKAGGAYVPMDPAHPAERLSYMLYDSGASVLLTQERLRDRMPPREGMRTVCVDGEWERIAAESAEAPESGVTSENLCYVIYTSGSTGRPKGVAMHHRGVVNYVEWGTRFYGADRGSGAPLFTSMAVDLTVTNLLPLFAGRPVHLLPEDGALEALAGTLRRRPGFGLIKITPLHLGLLNAMLAPEEMAEAAGTLVIGGDSLSAEHTLPWRDHAPGVRLINEYGPTETVVGCSAYVLPAGGHRDGPVPVGGPIQNLAFHVLDARLRPVPIGLPGELYIGGAGVARGYLGRPGLTAETFVPDPFAGPGARMYRAGDRARWREDGNLMILGRMDDQVKLRGYRVELGEVEAVLRRQDGVDECRVVVREDRPGDRRLVAYVAGRADGEALRASLGRSLPEYMVPGAFVMMDALPPTQTGKLDPRTLPAPEYGGGDAGLDEPRNYVEARLIPLWEELLGVRGIGPTQSWFDLGGNSLLSLRLFTRVNRAFECDLPVATLFAGATVREMANAVLRAHADPGPARSVVPLQPGGALPPVFFVHSGDRDVMGYVNLVRHLGPGQPAYGVRDLGDDLGRPIERIAAEHVADVRAVQPRGPYALVSWSFGGLVAFEMALQLQRAGEPVAFVGLLDTLAPGLYRQWPQLGDDDLLAGLAGEVAEGVRRPFALAPESLRGLELDEKVRRVAEALHAQGAAPAALTPAALADAFHAVRARGRSSLAYEPAGPFRGTVTLFRASVGSPLSDAFFAARPAEEREGLGWAPYVAGRVDVHAVPGSHVMLAAEPHVRVLAERMAAALAAAHGRAGAAGEARMEGAPA